MVQSALSNIRSACFVCIFFSSPDGPLIKHELASWDSGWLPGWPLPETLGPVDFWNEIFTAIDFYLSVSEAVHCQARRRKGLREREREKECQREEEEAETNRRDDEERGEKRKDKDRLIGKWGT